MVEGVFFNFFDFQSKTIKTKIKSENSEHNCIMFDVCQGIEINLAINTYKDRDKTYAYNLRLTCSRACKILVLRTVPSNREKNSLTLTIMGCIRSIRRKTYK